MKISQSDDDAIYAQVLAAPCSEADCGVGSKCQPAYHNNYPVSGTSDPIHFDDDGPLKYW